MAKRSYPGLNQRANSVGVVIPTLNAGEHVPRMVSALQSQTLVPERFLVIDSSSEDDTVAGFRAAGAEIRIIPRESFDHGGTRQMAVEILSDLEFIIFLTQDAIPAHPEALANLIAAFENRKTGVAYGRQLPSPGAGLLGAHARLFNYPDKCQLRGLADAPQYGIKTVFCSNSFAAYRRSALDTTCGFPMGTIWGEDMLIAASLLKNGWKIRYAAQAKVYHSHDYSLVEEFRRYFDSGVLLGSRSDLLGPFMQTSGEGLRFIWSEMNYLRSRAPHLVPLALAHTLCKYSGYRLGRLSGNFPPALNRRLSMNHGYWTLQDRRRDMQDAKRHSAN